LNKFGYPTISQIKADYDFEQNKYKHALNILFDEWVLISNKIDAAIATDDQSAMESILHKFITTLRRLDLESLVVWLEGIKSQFPIQKNKKAEIKLDVKIVLETILQFLKNQI